MGDQFSSGGSDQQVAKDQATFLNNQVTNQNVYGNNNIIAGIGDVNIDNKIINNYYLIEKVPPSEKDLASTSEHEDVFCITIRKESHHFFLKKLKVTWMFKGPSYGDGNEKTESYNIDEKQIKYFSIKSTEALNDYLNKINSGWSGVELKKLAKNGHELFNCLVSDCYFIENYMKEAKNSVKMLIDSHIDIPWNLIYIDSDINNVDLSNFIGNRYKISIYIFGSKEIFCKSSCYAASDHNQLEGIKNIITNQFENTIHLIDKKIDRHDREGSKLKTFECKSLKDFCEKIRVDEQSQDCIPHNLLFICFDKYDHFSFLKRKNAIYLGELKLSIMGLKRELSEIKKPPPFVIILGKKANHKVYIEIKDLFIHKLRWNGIVIDGDVDLDKDVYSKLIEKYLSDFFEKFNNENYAIPDVLLELRKKNPIGLAFTAYCNDKVCFKKYS